MLAKKTRRQPLLRSWTTRYLLTLFFGLILVGAFSTIWIRRNAVHRRIISLKALAVGITERVADAAGRIKIDANLAREIEQSQHLLGLGPDLFLFIVNHENEIIFGMPGPPPVQILQSITIPPYQEEGIQQLRSGPRSRFYILKQTIKAEERWIGAVYLIYPYREINSNPEELELLFFMLGSLAVLGWLTIYLLTRKLTKPIQKVAEAAKQFVKGNYDLKLDTNVREEEIYELIRAFNEMGSRLKQLEALRTELLANVSHELKTPVTVISGLLQAVKDEVVTGEEAREFLAIGIKETTRLQKMVEDLLDFNSFVSGELNVKRIFCNLNDQVREITDQWLLSQDEETVTVMVQVPEKRLSAAIDPIRLRQILYNLLNNAKQAFSNSGRIEVTLYETPTTIRIDVKDNGPGIPPEEQQLVFERFFRGSSKKERVRGMGLGLPFSKMMANALDGDLFLKSTSDQGTTFTLSLKK